MAKIRSLIGSRRQFVSMVSIGRWSLRNVQRLPTMLSTPVAIPAWSHYKSYTQRPVILYFPASSVCLSRGAENRMFSLAHLRENDLRGALTFIDKTLAVFDIKKLLEEELDTDEISQRKLKMALASGGYSLSHGLISRMGYAVKRLFSLIPQALNVGLNRPQVRRIHALDRTALQLWKRHALGDESDFDEVFANIVSAIRCSRVRYGAATRCDRDRDCRAGRSQSSDCTCRTRCTACRTRVEYSRS